MGDPLTALRRARAALAGDGTALGTLASDQALQALATAAGFGRFRRAAETPFNRIFEVRP